MKHEYKTIRIWIETLRDLKHIAADTGETIVALINRLAVEEKGRLNEKEKHGT